MNSDDAIHYAVTHSNLIEREPVKGPSFDNHLRAALLARTAADAGQLLHPRILHQLLFAGLPSDPRHARDPRHPVAPGQYRDVDVYVMQAGGQRHRFPPHQQVPALTDGLWGALWGARHYGSHDLRKASVRWDFHAWFESIHPFPDGNGRTGRLLWWNMEMLVGTGITVIAYGERFDYYDRLDAWRLAHCNEPGMNPFKGV